jgi:hypothetical protein
MGGLVRLDVEVSRAPTEAAGAAGAGISPSLRAVDEMLGQL